MIKMKAGVFGLRVNGIVKAMDKNSGPFSAGEEQETRLVKLGIAEYVTGPAPTGLDETIPEDTGGIREEIPLEDMSGKDLRDLGEKYGLAFKANAKKADMIEAIKAAQAESDEGEDTEGGEDAPAFDPSEAVQ